MKLPRDALEDILAECRFLKTQTAQTDYMAFLKDEVLKRAFSRSIEIIGEAVKSLPADLISSHPEIPWRRMAGMRDRLIHGYFAVDYSLVWDVASHQLSTLEGEVASMLEASGIRSQPCPDGSGRKLS